MLRGAEMSNRFLGNRTIQIRCPGCMHLATMSSVGGDVPLEFADGAWSKSDAQAGLRICPNTACRALIFVVFSSTGLIQSYPGELVDFDATDVPDRVRENLEEAILCHSVGAYTAAGMLIRKTLEALCQERGCAGNTLHERLVQLQDAITVPAELLSGVLDLKLLGNDAAHIEAKTYEKVGKEEVEIALEFTKEILKAVYQLGKLLSRLRSFQKQPGSGA
jgi:hypothetical protein